MQMTEQCLQEIIQILGEGNVLRDEPMAAHTSFRVGGPADVFVRVESEDALRQVLSLLRDEGEPYYLLGRGTNLLVGDHGYRGCIITLGGPSMTEVTFDGTRVTAGAGETLAALSVLARDGGLSGLEFASGIPGSVGGALVMNAGAYGGSMDQVVVSAQLLMPDDSVQEVTAADLHFGYRQSLLKEVPAIALQVTMELRSSDPKVIGAKMRELAAKRSEKQPLEYPSAGSTFKRPEGMFAGKLIMDAGLRGFSIGGAAVSEKHCGFIINKGGASAADVRAVIGAVRRRVYEMSGVMLEEEVIELGEF